MPLDRFLLSPRTQGSLVHEVDRCRRRLRGGHIFALLLLLATLSLRGHLIFALLLLLDTLFLGGHLTFAFLFLLATLFLWGSLAALLMALLTLMRWSLAGPREIAQEDVREECMFDHRAGEESPARRQMLLVAGCAGYPHQRAVDLAQPLRRS